jgi:adenylate kinase
MITGPQGSGKTTQAEILAKKLGFCEINTGDLLRELAEGDSPEGKILKTALDQGQLADDQIVSSVVNKKMASPECQKGLVADGYPRRVGQLNIFNPNFDKVFYLDVPDSIVEDRLIIRGREDDTPELIRERLQIYHQETEPVLAYYQNLGKLIKIDGCKNIESVTAEIEKYLK